jgi:outer membrane protein assembly factor BamB
MRSKPEEVTASARLASNDVPTPEYARFPIWWWLLVAAGFLASVVVSNVDQAYSYLVAVATVFLGIVIFLVRYLRSGSGRFAVRVLPLAGFVGITALMGAVIRVDDMTGNLVPTKVSLRWHPRRDELLEMPVPRAVEGGVDLATTTADDFPQFLGPDRNAEIEGPLLATDWRSKRPAKVWTREIGAGWSGFAVVNGYAVTLEQRGELELTTCYEIETGEPIWSNGVESRHQTVPGGVGPRSTPTIHGGRVYTLGAVGMLSCLDGASGEVLWRRDLLEEIGLTQEEDVAQIAWGRSASPLVDDGRVIVPLGGKDGPSLAAYDALKGDLLWAQGKHQIGYSSPIIAELDGSRQIVLVCEDFVCGFDANSGSPLWEYGWPGKSNASPNVSQPVPAGDSRLLVSKGYAHGAALLRISNNDDNWSVEEIWRRHTVMKTKFTTAIVHEDHVYGLDDSILECVELATGKRKWKGGRFGHGQILRVGDVLLVQAEQGDIHLVAFNSAKFEPLTKTNALTGKTWNNPALYGQLLLLRNAQQAVCLRVPLRE